MAINTEYLNSIINGLLEIPDKKYIYESKPKKCKDAKWYLIYKTRTPKRFIEHVKYYIDIRTPELPEVYFNQDYTILYII